MVSDVKTDKAETKSAAAITVLSDQSSTHEDVEETIEETTLSAPDSSGNQYPVSIKKTNRKRTAKQDKNITAVTEKSSTEAARENITDNSKSTINEQTETSEKTSVKVSTPSWVLWLILLVVIAALIVVLLFLKKWRIL